MALLQLFAKKKRKLSESFVFGSWRSGFLLSRRWGSSSVQPDQDHLFPKLVIPGEIKGGEKEVVLENNKSSKTRRCLEASIGEDGYFTFNKDIHQLQHTLLPVPHDHYCCGSNLGGWLVLVDDSFKVQLFNPLSGVRFDLPSSTTLPPPQPYCTRFSKHYISKAVISSDPTTSSTTTVLIIHGGCPQRIAMCKLGDKAWTPLESPGSERRYYMDAIYYKHKFYALSVGGTCDIIDTDGPTVTPFAKEAPGERYLESSYLIESNGHLFMAVRIIEFDNNKEDDEDHGRYGYLNCYRTTEFRVYKLKEKSYGRKKWKRVEDIGKNAFFVSHNTSFSLPALGRCKPNSIYFTEGKKPYGHVKEPIRHDIGVFSLKHKRVDQIFWADSNPMRPPPFWLTSS